MQPKNVVTIVLLLFVTASIIVIVVKSFRRSPKTADAANQPDGKQSAEAAEGKFTDGTIAYYFHGNMRCPTCRRIESYAHEAVQTGFAEELSSGRLQWQVVNYELPENGHFAADYELIAPTVVLVEISGGSRKQWKNLARVWELVGNKEAFLEYVQNGIQDYLEDNK